MAITGHFLIFPLLRLLVLLLLASLRTSAWLDHFGRARELVCFTVPSGRQLVLLFDGRLHEAAPDNFATVTSLGARLQNLTTDEAFQLYKTHDVGSPLTSLRHTEVSPHDYGEAMRVEIARTEYLAPPLHYHHVLLLGAPMINPAIVRWRNQTVLCYRTSWAPHGHMVVETIDLPLLLAKASRAAEVNNSNSNHSSTSNSTALPASPRCRQRLVFMGQQAAAECPSNAGNESWHFGGAFGGAVDVRMLPTPDGRLLFIYTLSNVKFFIRLFSSHAAILPSPSRRPGAAGAPAPHAGGLDCPPEEVASFSQQVWFGVTESGYPGKLWGRAQKNWVPFVHRGRALFAQSLNPLHIMAFVEEGAEQWGNSGCGVPSNESALSPSSPGVAPASSPSPAASLRPQQQPSQPPSAYRAFCTTVSLAPLLELHWDWGELRGGTPAVALPDSPYYLLFFHSRHVVAGNGKTTTYFMGALTFYPDARDTFRIHSISRAPITLLGDLSLYRYRDRRQDNTKYETRYDFVVYPIGILLADDGASVSVSLGHQDSHGYLFTVGLRSLLESMRCVGGDCGNATAV